MVKLFVEGGGDAAALKAACREGFTTFITKAGVTKRPRVVACGSRNDAYQSYCTAITHGEAAMLLVDSEDAVSAQNQAGPQNQWLPWKHLLQRDNWNQPGGCSDTDCHLMVEVMESWFLADRETLEKFFGQGFRASALPAAANPIEGVTKPIIYSALQSATQTCKTKVPYGKSEHSFKLLAAIDPAKITAASPWGNRFVEELKQKMSVSN